MLLLSCQDVSRGYDATPLFEGVTFELHAGERLGFVGPNGAGKTTFMKLLCGIDPPESGVIKYHAGARFGMLLQVAEFPPGRTLFEEAKSAFDELMATQTDLVATAEKLATCTDEILRKQLSAKYDRLTELLSSQDAYQLDHKVEDVLSGLNFLERDYHREVRSFSGGQQRRLLLAKLLLSAPDIMLLDEPSNHLDIATTRWLENYLAVQKQGMIVVSHDRYFLGKVCNRMLELHNRRITMFPGGYKQYVRLRDEKYEREMKEYIAQQEYIDKQEEYIRRAHYGQLAKQAQSRAKSLEKLEVLEKPTKISGPAIRFNDVVRSGDTVFSGFDLTKRFGEKVLFENLSFDLPRGRRLGIMGPNGCGKTTLLRMLLGEEPPTSGKVQRGHLVFPGYLDQHLKLLDEEKSVIQAIWPDPDPTLTEQKMRELLATFGLHGKLVHEPVKQLSGGEKSRAALAKITIAGVNVLILDEPTNHLDIWACDSLEEAVKAFEGTVIVVTHDRYFLNRVVDMLIVIEDGRTEVVYGNYETYERLLAHREEVAAEEKAKKRAEKPREELAPADIPVKQKRKRKFAYRKVAEIEEDITKVEAEIAGAESQLADPEIYKDGRRVTLLMTEIEALKNRLADLYAHWEEASELNNER
ncbi:MAG: ABC-F family ATP-binding cassette domain-containing protein [Fimbriiglobus sp.]